MDSGLSAAVRMVGHEDEDEDDGYWMMDEEMGDEGRMMMCVVLNGLWPRLPREWIQICWC